MCFDCFGQAGQTSRGLRSEKEWEGSLVSINSSSLSREIFVRIVHAGGKEELYQNVIPASKVMEKYPGMCVARPEVFKKPHESLLWPEDKLFPGQKYYIPSSTVQKLKRKHPGNVKVVEPAKGKHPGNTEVVEPAKGKQEGSVEVDGSAKGGEEVIDASITWDSNDENMDASVSSAKAFYASRFSKEKRPRSSLSRRGRRGKKPFAPPLPRIRSLKESGWEPSLASIEETSL